MRSLPWDSPNPVIKALDVHLRDDVDDEAICLPSDLVAATPACAISCIQDFTLTNYRDNTCPFTCSLTYLCTSTTSSGLTIGEGSIQCLVSRCSGKDLIKTGVYNICDPVPGAILKTASVITATIQPVRSANTMATPLPPTIGNPMITQDVTSIVMASGIPSIASPTSAPPSPIDPDSVGSASTQTIQSLPSITSSETKSSASAVAVSDRASPNSGLSSSKIAGIGVSAGLATLLILALFFWRCQRRERLQRRRSMRWSIHGSRTHPPNYGSPPDLPATAKAPNGSFLPAAASNQRFYSAARLEEKRRSFWRRSIKPEDIGVAVSPHVVENSSPASFSSQQSLTKLLPKVPEKLPTRTSKELWPPPVSLEIGRSRRSLTYRPTSDATVFDEDLEANVAFAPLRPSDVRESASIMNPSEKRERAHPAPLQLSSTQPHAFLNPWKGKEQSPTALIPLTPTYDNGNILQSLPRTYPPSSWKQNARVNDLFPPPPLSALPEEMSPTRHASPHKNVLRKKAPQPIATEDARSQPAVVSSEPKSPPHRKDSGTTVATDIEEDTSPEGVEKELEMVEKPKLAAILLSTANSPSEGPRSPISDLKYPAVPRSAGMSRHADFVPRPLNYSELPSTPTRSGPRRPSRVQLVRNEASFMVTETTSSDGYLSDRSIEWPVPPPPQGARHPLKAGMSELREHPSSANRGFGNAAAQRSMDQVLRFGARSSSLMPPPLASSKAKLAPDPTQDGDLYFKVEM